MKFLAGIHDKNKQIPDESDIEGPSTKKQAYTLDGTTQAASRTSVELKENIEIRSIKDIPNFQVLLFQNVPQ